ncbi:zinc finger protein 36-like [Typha angustifolia]|uniref:zinc finger protein 36-like n=1 Tax=Typha angustifolia TaxID=59011 RepID=UPI003C2E9F59
MAPHALLNSTTLSLPSPKLSASALLNPISQDDCLALCLVMLSHGSKKLDCLSSTPSLPFSELSYECSICGKSFASYQALGGHKSSHRKPGGHEHIAPIPRPEVVDASGGGGAHRCSVCHRGFATGQALGGHKRRHYLEGSSSVSGSASVSVSSVRDFDLNLPASVEFGMRSWVEEEEVLSPLPVKKQRLG